MILIALGHSQNHLAVAGGYAVGTVDAKVRCATPTRYREVVLTLPKSGFDIQTFTEFDKCNLLIIFRNLKENMIYLEGDIRKLH